jgi:hypothetical protein
MRTGVMLGPIKATEVASTSRNVSELGLSSVGLAIETSLRERE